MTDKELLYIEDALGHEKFFETKCREASEKIEAGDQVEIDFETGVITNVTKGETYQGQPFPEFLINIINKGGLLNSLK